MTRKETKTEHKAPPPRGVPAKMDPDVPPTALDDETSLMEEINDRQADANPKLRAAIERAKTIVAKKKK